MDAFYGYITVFYQVDEKILEKYSFLKELLASELDKSTQC